MTRTRKLAAAALAASVLAGALASAPAQAAPQTPAQQLSPTAQASPRSQASLGTTQSAPPSVGAGFAATAQWLARGTVSLEWDDVTGATGYEVMWRSEPGGAAVRTRPRRRRRRSRARRPSALVGSLPQHWASTGSRCGPKTLGNVAVVAQLFCDWLFLRHSRGHRPGVRPFHRPHQSNIDLERLGRPRHYHRARPTAQRCPLSTWQASPSSTPPPVSPTPTRR